MSIRDVFEWMMVGFTLIAAVVFIYEIFTPGELYPMMGGFSALFIGGAVPAGIMNVLLIRRRS